MELKGKFKKETFIYFLLKNKKIVYVGQTTNGLNRIKEHLLDCNKEFDDFKIIKCNESELKELENNYIIKFNPEYNKNLNSFNVKSQYVIRKLNEKLNFNPYSVKGIKEIIHISPFKKELFKGDEVILKEDADKLIDFLLLKFQNLKSEIEDYFEQVK
jgi:hypothetical protein